MIEIRFSGAHVDRPVIRSRFDLLLGVVALIEIWIGNRLLYREEEFPIVELRAALTEWLAVGFLSRQDFEFQSMESDEVGLLWLRHDPLGWRIGSIHQEFPAVDTLADEEIEPLVRRFVDDVDQWLLDHCDPDARSLL